MNNKILNKEVKDMWVKVIDWDNYELIDEFKTNSKWDVIKECNNYQEMGYFAHPIFEDEDAIIKIRKK